MLDFGRDACGDRRAAAEREWLVTNGLGGYAMGTVAGLLTRRYHGLLIAALQPPVVRALLAAKLDETALYDGRPYPLFANRWAHGLVEPEGFRYLERFHLEGITPVWTYALADALLEKRVWMEQGANTTYVRYTLRRATGPLSLSVEALVNFRDHHGSTHVEARPLPLTVESVDHGLRVIPPPGLETHLPRVPFYLLSDRAAVTRKAEWRTGFFLALEQSFGLDPLDDHLCAGRFEVALQPGESATFVATAEPGASLDGAAASARRRAHEARLLQQAQPNLRHAPAPVRHLVLAADQFVVHRALPGDPDGRSVIAGYPWFGDWGRDTMIALPGLTLVTGRFDAAERLLRTFAHYVSQGMLPNRFPDEGQAPEYNTVDATLWYFEAIRAYYEATHDETLLRDLFHVLQDIVDWHVRGTRYQIHVDPADGLLYAGEPGVQLTWMDAKVDDWVVTPRIGKPVEVNALWYNALCVMADFARLLEKDGCRSPDRAQPAPADGRRSPEDDGRRSPDRAHFASVGDLRRSRERYQALADQARIGFARFWNEEAGYLYDVLDGPNGNDPALRPNQLFAVSLPHSPLPPAQQKAVVDSCARHLLTSHGLRSLDPRHPDYKGHHGGDRRTRDAAYHQGTVWGWLIGPFVSAHLRVYCDPALARSFLAPLIQELDAHGVGSLSEIFDGDPPFTPRGCIAQAWTLAEVLRAWRESMKWGERTPLDSLQFP